MTHICVGKLTIIGSDNGLPPGWRQAIIWTNAGILLIAPWTNFSEILIKIQTFSLRKMRFENVICERQPFGLGLNVLTRSLPVRDGGTTWDVSLLKPLQDIAMKPKDTLVYKIVIIIPQDYIPLEFATDISLGILIFECLAKAIIVNKQGIILGLHCSQLVLAEQDFYSLPNKVQLHSRWWNQIFEA